jgi:allantoinase
MSTPELIIRGQRVVLTEDADGPSATHRIASASIHISRGGIDAIKAFDDPTEAAEVITAGYDSVVMPGLVDSHVHMNEPGRTEWEGFATATQAAAAGGVTTLIDMPLNSIPPTTTVSGLKEKLKAARHQCHVDVGFWGGVVPGNTNELDALFSAGVVGFKCFLVHSGVDEFPNVAEKDLREALPALTRLGAVLIVHAEVPGPIDHASTANEPPSTYRTFLKSRPRAAENDAVALMIKLAREFGTRVHIVHHSSADALPDLRKAQAEGLQITAETCPHYLFFAAEEIANGATEFKCCPPIRETENREQLWHALADGTIGMVVSDHSPCPPEMKLRDKGDFLAAWGGISSLQLRLPVVWTSARKRGHGLTDMVEWLCEAPARLVGLDTRKGAIAPGYDADVIIWNPEQSFTVDEKMIHHRHKLTPYMGHKLQGVVEQTFLRGKKIYDNGQFPVERSGQLLNVKG